VKTTSRFAHKLVKSLGIEEIFARLGSALPYTFRFIPLHYNYSANDQRTIYRDDVYFNVNMSDYMQWHIFANLPEASWLWANRLCEDGSVVFDIGANVGVFSLKLAQRCQKEEKKFRIHAFEPNPAICQAFEGNLQLNPALADQIHVEKVCLSSESGKIPFHIDDANTGGGSVLAKATAAAREILVDAITLDEFVARNELERIDFIKIDVEGSEPLVLAGAIETIKQHMPFLYIEMTNPWFRKLDSSNQKIIDMLIELGYRCEEVEDTKVLASRPLNQARIDGDNQFNIVAFPPNFVP